MPLTRLEDLNAVALTDVLRAAPALDEARVVAVQVDRLGGEKGAMSGAARIALEYDRPEMDAPRTLIAKFAVEDPGLRAINSALGLYRREVAFYMQLADRVALPTPRCYYAHYADTTGAFLLLLEDLVAARNGSRVAGCTLAEAELIIGEIARLHAAWWLQPCLGKLDWLRPFDLGPLQETYRRSWNVFVARMGSRLTDELRTIGELLGTHLAALFERYWDAPWTLVHNDIQLDNIFFSGADAAPKLTIIDWQSVVRGQGALDVAGFLGGNLTIEERRAHEDRLLKLYHQQLLKRGVRGYSLADLRAGYRAALFDGFSRMVIAIASQLTPEQERIHRDILWPRYSAAVLDLQADALLRQLG